jgi:hypothetical protein
MKLVGSTVTYNPFFLICAASALCNLTVATVKRSVQSGRG